MRATLAFLKRTRMLQRCAVFMVLLLCSSCTYMKMNPPPDADKAVVAGNNSCWLATASNMLAGAGYGDGSTVQARADDVYGDMTAHYGTLNGGWTDTALTWWLGSNNNTWPTNPYTIVTVYGNKMKIPWANADGPEDMGNELRSCNFEGVSISWPPLTATGSAYGGHAITDWGDNGGNSNSISSNPSQVRLTDSDTDAGGDVQVYTYDSYTNPNPGGFNSGNGWYIDYGTNHPFIKHIVTLSPVSNPGGGKAIQKVLGSYKIHQKRKTAADDLHYKVGTDVEILSYRTWLDWHSDLPPTITEGDPRRSIKVDWDLSDNNVPYCRWVTITTEFVLPRWNAISYSDVYFTYPRLIEKLGLASIAWQIETPLIERATKIPNITGGYVVGSFDIVDPTPSEGDTTIGQYRFIHQYSFDQTPEKHVFTLKGENRYTVTNLRFGHSYGYLDEKGLWEFSDWMTKSEKSYRLSREPIKVMVDWTGRLPYPEGEIVPWVKDPSLIKRYLRQ